MLLAISVCTEKVIKNHRATLNIFFRLDYYLNSFIMLSFNIYVLSS